MVIDSAIKLIVTEQSIHKLGDKKHASLREVIGRLISLLEF